MDRSFDLDKPVTRSEIEALYFLILGRAIAEDVLKQAVEASGITIRNLARALIDTEEFLCRFGSMIGRNLPISDLDFEKPMSQADVEEFFHLFLEREVGDDGYKRAVEASGQTIRQGIQGLLSCPEFIAKFKARIGTVEYRPDATQDVFYRVPCGLEQRPDDLKKVLLIGSCLMDQWVRDIAGYNRLRGFTTSIERVVFNNASRLPALDASAAREYDFQVLQIPIRSVLSEGLYFGLRYSDDKSYEDIFEEACRRVQINLERGMEYNSSFGVTSFILSFITPQQNLAGRLLPRYSLSNVVFFIEELNRHLWKLCQQYRNAYFVDVNEILGTLGKRYFQDDSVTHFNHGSAIGSLGDEIGRLEPLGNIDALYTPKVSEFVAAIYHEIAGSYRSIRQRDSVKVVIFDLDDTLWRGVGADTDSIGPHMTEGWPLGVLEAASYLWRRGILLALVSKNDEENVNRIWEALYGGLFPLKNFAVTRINWRPKPDNVAEVLQTLNLLPGNALFVDDNPLERAAVKATFPDIRVIDAPVANWRRILLWSPELQVPAITSEAVARTEMIQAQAEREGAKASVGHPEFLASLGLSVDTWVIQSANDPKFQRCFELLNKTNQFNTTGRRWSPAEMHGLIADGGYLIAAEAKDRYTAYGVIGVVVAKDNVIEQFVMSCRVLGMDVEIAILARVLGYMNRADVMARLIRTEKNRLCLDLYENCGFWQLEEGLWKTEAGNTLAIPAHIHSGAPSDEQFAAKSLAA